MHTIEQTIDPEDPLSWVDIYNLVLATQLRDAMPESFCNNIKIFILGSKQAIIKMIMPAVLTGSSIFLTSLEIGAFTNDGNVCLPFYGSIWKGWE